MPNSDVIIVGGGLSGAIAAVALQKAFNNKTITLIEAGPNLGGNHRWSYFSSDLNQSGHALLKDLEKLHWSEYEVRFPSYVRRMKTPYYSFTDHDLSKWVHSILPHEAIRLNCAIAHCDAHSVTLQDGQKITAKLVLDARGWDGAAIGDHVSLGYQKFVGVMINQPNHGQLRPIIMDATVDQIDGYRFVYTLPIDPDHLFVEDTYYSDGAELNVSAITDRIQEYFQQGTVKKQIVPVETGVLPIVISGAIPAQDVNAHAVPIGVRGGYFHHVTSYSLPHAVSTALQLAKMMEGGDRNIADRFAAMQAQSWKTQAFGRLLNKMLFRGAGTQERRNIMQRFYRLPEGTIERFYGSRLSYWDKFRILAGRPPIPITSAIKAIFS